ncbi:multiheme c-type cytochrome [Ferrimonas balearica]|uniref:multiheme c-type cytochrome n=1 Tax=Ferrimonas balearica TaxID=44012 RepID=UPI001C98F88B|nr:multiheme c-type cytochrome [Ferrimonas balearica]MBY5991605.1 deca-heme c-type cytochrome [Ferrimonas balearica]
MFTLLTLAPFLLLWPIGLDANPPLTGSEACGQCHTSQYQQWQGSDHQLAMAVATERHVLGNFDDQRLQLAGQPFHLYRQDGQYWATLNDGAGQAQTLQVQHTFGHYPLQQYLVTLPGGRLQLLPLAWDSRAAEQGGQRWFHLYPRAGPNDRFYWTNTGQNWNSQCADCHVTGYEKGYDTATNTYQSRYQEAGVGCQACHGSGEAHQRWAWGDRAGPDPGLERQLKALPIAGVLDGFAADLTYRQQSMACAQCHSRRLQLDDDAAVLDFHRKYRLNLLSAARYHPDGQIDDENFVLGSFMQSKMAAAGVVCSHCHNPHSSELVAPEPRLCLQCHTSNYAERAHHRHPNGAKLHCSDCHMPVSTFMQVDPRHDHSFRVPRPDLSVSLGVPNVCSECHQKDAQWASDTLRRWYPDSPYQQQRHFAQAFAEGAQQRAEGERALAHVAQDHTEPDMVRAAALSRLLAYAGPNAALALARASRESSPLITLGVIKGAGGLAAPDRWDLLNPLLDHPNPAFRADAAARLVRVYSELTPSQQAALAPALQTHRQRLAFNADRGFGRVAMGDLARHLGQWPEAQAHYRDAVAIEPRFALGHVRLAEAQRAMGQNEAERATLLSARERLPESAAIAFALGLSQVRSDEPKSARQQLAQAVSLAPENPDYRYVYALSLEAVAPDQAVEQMMAVYERSRFPRHLYAACELGLRNALPSSGACLKRLADEVGPNWADALKQRYP